MGIRPDVEYSDLARAKSTSYAILFAYYVFELFLLNNDKVLGDVCALVQHQSIILIKCTYFRNEHIFNVYAKGQFIMKLRGLLEVVLALPEIIDHLKLFVHLELVFYFLNLHISRLRLNHQNSIPLLEIERIVNFEGRVKAILSVFLLDRR